MPTRTWLITTEAVESYRNGLGSEAAPGVPQMLANAPEPTFLFSRQRGHLWLRQEWEFFRPLAVGVQYTLDAVITDIYQRRDRTILVWETTLRDPGANPVSIQRHHQSFLLHRAPNEEVVLRDPASKEGASRPAPEMAAELATMERTVTLEMCGELFHGSKNYHTDKEQSKALGFRDVVVGGRMTMGFIGELLDSTFGERWARSGRLLVKFTNVLWPGEVCRVTLGLGGVDPNDPTRDTVVARAEKPDGTVVIVAEGSIART